MRTMIWMTALAVSMVMAAACGSSGAPKKAGGARGMSAASSGQKAGSSAMGAMGSASSQGSESSGVTCDSSLDGAGWCETDTDLIFCSGGSWYLLDCNAVEEGAFCGYDEDLNSVDCFIE